LKLQARLSHLLHFGRLNLGTSIIASTREKLIYDGEDRLKHPAFDYDYMINGYDLIQRLKNNWPCTIARVDCNQKSDINEHHDLITEKEKVVIRNFAQLERLLNFYEQEKGNWANTVREIFVLRDA